MGRHVVSICLGRYIYGHNYLNSSVVKTVIYSLKIKFVMNLQVLKAILLICSNLFMIPAIIFGYKIRSFYVATSILITMVVSILYHTCDSTGACLGNASVDTWRTVDHAFANNAIAMTFIILLEFDKPLIKMLKFIHLPDEEILQFVTTEYNIEKIRYISRLKLWGDFIKVMYTSAIIIYVNIRPTDETVTPFVILIGNMAIFVKLIMLSDKERAIFTSFYWNSLIIGVIMGVIAIFFYSINNLNGLYWVWHTLWHSLGFLSLYFLQMGMTKDMENWHGLLFSKENKHRGIITV
jgi:hypothetical protein